VEPEKPQISKATRGQAHARARATTHNHKHIHTRAHTHTQTQKCAILKPTGFSRQQWFHERATLSSGGSRLVEFVLLLTCKGCSHCSSITRQAWTRDDAMASEEEVLITSASFIVQSISSISLMYRQQSESLARVTCEDYVRDRGPVHIRTSHKHEWSGPTLIRTLPVLFGICKYLSLWKKISEWKTKWLPGTNWSTVTAACFW
jgi:hypothetical protein